MSSQPAPHPLVHDPDYASLKRYVIESTGLAYYADKDNDLAYRLGIRLSQLKLDQCGAYLSVLRNSETGEAERHLLVGQLTIGETFFFRHAEQFDALRDVVFPDLIERNRGRRTLRIWSAGCATGAEPYSVAILLKRSFASRIAGWDVQIIGTDLNQSFLARAERGRFEEWALRSTPDDIRREWFSQSGKSWTIVSEARKWISFQYHNLVEHPYPSLVHGITALDLILCRNVMIYFDWKVVRRIIGQFRECLVEGGWLAVGHAESNPEIFQAYRTLSVPGATLYQKIGEGASLQSASFPRAATPAPRQSAAIQAPWVPPVLPPLPAHPAARADQHGAAPAGTGLELIRRCADEGKWDDAVRECGRLLDKDGLNPIAHFYHALILEQTGHQADAERALRRAIYLDRNFALAHYHLALLLRRTDNREGAIQSLANVRRLVSRMNRHQQIPEFDGLTAEELGQLTEMHLALLRQ